jgi:uncharacterized membrane protein
MNLRKHKALILILTGGLALVVASSVLQQFLFYPQTDFYTEMWLLSSEHTTKNYPFNINRGETYNGFLVIANNLGHDAQYVIQVKFRNQTQSAANVSAPSNLPSLYDIDAFVADKEQWEIPIRYSFNYLQGSYNANTSQVQFLDVTFNNNVLNLNGYNAVWDDERSGFYGNLFFELWIYDGTAGPLIYHGRSTGLWFNMTS